MYKVYEIKTTDGKVYVGCTRQKMSQRMAVHRYQEKIFVLSEHSLTVVFESENEEEALSEEARLIHLYDSTNPEKGYNRRFGGNYYGFPDYVDHFSNKTSQTGTLNPMFGKVQSQQTREKIRMKALQRHPSTFEKNRKKTSEQIEKLQKGRERFYIENGPPMLGKNHSDLTKKKISEKAKGNKRWLGKKHSQESIDKMRASQKAWRDKKKLELKK